MRLAAALVVAAGLLAGCRQGGTQQLGCTVDADCGAPPEAFRCEAETGVCYCRTDDACPGSQFCNLAGFCQDRAGCERNEDCLSPTLFCDTTSGTCLPVGRCVTDLQCSLGEVCDFARRQCVAGCRRNGDCAGVSCRCGDVACTCTGSTPEELARCQLGVCDATFCAEPSFCRFGEQCGAPDGGARAACFSDYDPMTRPYCDRCTSGAGTSTCGRGPNYCLIDARNPGAFFCGADCSRGQACPNGYTCQDVIVITEQVCFGSSPVCPVKPGLTCQGDADCPRGGACVKPPGAQVGACAARCAIGEGDSTGFCTCLENADCAQNACSQGECTISRRPCVQDQDCDPVRCVDFGGVGGCLIGQNCAPGSGLSCIEVR